MSIVYNIRWGIKLPSVTKNTRKDFSSQVSLSIPILFSLIMASVSLHHLPFNLFNCLNFCLLNNSDTKRIRSCMHTNRCSNLVDSDLIDSKPFFYQILYHLTESDCLVIVITISDAKIIFTRFCIDLVQIIFSSYLQPFS